MFLNKKTSDDGGWLFIKSLISHSIGIKVHTVSVYKERCVYDLSTLQRTPTCEDQTERGVRHHEKLLPAPQLLMMWETVSHGSLIPNHLGCSVNRRIYEDTDRWHALYVKNDKLSLFCNVGSCSLWCCWIVLLFLLFCPPIYTSEARLIIEVYFYIMQHKFSSSINIWTY